MISYRNKEVDTNFENFLKKSSPKIVQLFMDESKYWLRLKCGRNLKPILDAANSLGTKYLSVEAFLKGKEWEFSDNHFNKKVFNGMVEFFDILQKYNSKI